METERDRDTLDIESLYEAQLDRLIYAEDRTAVLVENARLRLSPHDLRHRLNVGFKYALTAQLEAIRARDEEDEMAASEKQARADALSKLVAYEGLNDKLVANIFTDQRELMSVNEFKLMQIETTLEHVYANGHQKTAEAVISFMHAAYDLQQPAMRPSRIESLKESIANNPKVRSTLATVAIVAGVSVANLNAAGSAAAATAEQATTLPAQPSQGGETTPEEDAVTIVSTPKNQASPEKASVRSTEEDTVVVVKQEQPEKIIAAKPAVVKEDDPGVVIIDKKTLDQPEKIVAPAQERKSDKGDDVISILPPASPAPPSINIAPAPAAPATPEAPSTSPEKPAATSDLIQAARDLAKRTDLTPKQTSWKNTSFVMEYLLNHGFEPHQAVGVLANMMWESSGVVFDKHQDGGSAYGVVQWDSGRRDKLFAEAARLGVPVSDPTFQMDFFMHELEQYPYLGLAQLKATATSAEATRSFEATFERAGKPEIEQRLKFAEIIRANFNQAYTEIQNAKKAASPESNVPAGWPSDPEAARAMFNQCDPRWGNIVSPHGIRTCNIACGPTSVAWVVDALRPEVAITPKETIEFMNKNDLWLTPEGGARDSGGASFDDVKILGENWGLKGEQMKKPDLHNIEAYKEIFKKGGKIIAAGSGPSPFVQAPAAHFVIIRGITDDGKFLINDPYPKPDAPDTNERPWDANQIMNGIFGAVVFTK